MLRKGQAQKNYQEQIDDYEDDISLNYIKQETLTLLYDAIDKLPPKYKPLFALSFEQGLKNAEVAEYFHIAEITVKKQKARIIELLRDSLKDKMEEKTIILLITILS